MVGSVLYPLIGAVWVIAASPTWVWYLPLGWFLLVAMVGAFIPGVANQVSLARAYLVAPVFLYGLAGRTSAEWFGLVALVVAIAGVTDLVDGLFVGALAIGLALGGAFPLWLALVVIARYLLPALGGGLLIVLGRRPELRHTLTGQVSTVLILFLVGGICLLRGLHQDSSGLASAAVVVIPLATLATFAHLAWASRRSVGVPGPA